MGNERMVTKEELEELKNKNNKSKKKELNLNNTALSIYEKDDQFYVVLLSYDFENQEAVLKEIKQVQSKGEAIEMYKILSAQMFF